MNKMLLIAIIALAVIIGGVSIGVAVYANQPETVFANSLTGVFEDFLERDELAPIVSMLTKGSLSVNVESTSDEVDGKISGKIYFGETELMVEDLFIKAEGIELGADLYLSEKYGYISNEEILDGTYGFVCGELADQFENSIFAPGSGTDFEIGQEEFDAIMKLLEAYDDETFSEMSEDIEKHVKNYYKCLMKSIAKHAEYESETDDVKVGGERISARVITVTIDEKAVVEILNDLYDELEDDKALRKDVIKYSDYFQDLLEMTTGKSQDIEDLYDDMIDQLGESLEELDEDSMGEGDLIFEIVTPKASSKMLQMTVTMKSDGYKQELFTLDLGKDGINKTDSIKFSSNGMSVEYKVKENNSKEYSASLKYVPYSSAESQTIFEIKVDKKNDSYRFKIPAENIEIKGDFITKSGATTITVDKVLGDGEAIELPVDISIIIDEKDSMPKPLKESEVTGVLELSVEDIEKIMAKAEEIFGNLGIVAPEKGVPQTASEAVSAMQSAGYSVTRDSFAATTLAYYGVNNVEDVVVGYLNGEYVILIYFTDYSSAYDAFNYNFGVIEDMYGYVNTYNSSYVGGLYDHVIVHGNYTDSSDWYPSDSPSAGW